MTADRPWELWRIHAHLAELDLAAGPWAELGLSESCYQRGAAPLFCSALVELSGWAIHGPADLPEAAAHGAQLLRAELVSCSQFERAVAAVVQSLEQRLRAAGLDPARV